MTTRLEALIADHVQHATVTTLAQTVELTAEQLAREILSDPAFRAEMRALVQRAFRHTLTDLNRATRRNGKRKGGAR